MRSAVRKLAALFVVTATVGVLLVAAMPVAASHQVFVVTSTGDGSDAMPGDGTCGGTGPAPSLGPGETLPPLDVPCTLRAAIEEANAHEVSTEDTFNSISFDIPSSDPNCSDGVCTIRPATELPPITQPVLIDGYTQPGASPNTGEQTFGLNTVLTIELDGINTSNSDGLVASGAAVTLQGLVINNFDLSGVRLVGNVAGSKIAGNFVGSDPAGAVAKANGYGVSLSEASGVTIGGDPNPIYDPGARNLISGNLFDGVQVSGGSGNILQGNMIGLDATGLAPLGNGSAGVYIGGSDDNIIRSNSISANGQSGVAVSGTDEASAATGNVIDYNFIGGYDQNYGDENSGNAAHGVILDDYARNTLVGAAPSSGGGNLIDANFGDGVAIEGSTSFGNTLSANLILRNSGLGINLDEDAVTDNDELDADAGANTLQNFPILTDVSYTESGTVVTGSIDTAANTNVRIEMFAVNECDATGYGEGWGYMDPGPPEVVTDDNGHADFTWTMNGFSGSPYFTATATVAGNTSEFSPCVVVPPAPGGGGGATAGPGPSQPPATPNPATQPPATPNPATQPPATPAASQPPGSETTSETVAPGGTVTSDREGDGATPSDPIETSVTSPNGGTVTIEETSITEPAPAGFTFLGQQVNITAPPATAQDPLVIVFRLDASLLDAHDPAEITVFRDGVPLVTCDPTPPPSPGPNAPPTPASPDPCLSGRQILADGDLQLTALTSAASAWNFGVRVGGRPSVAPVAAAPTDADGDGVPDTAGVAPVVWNLTIPAALLVIASGGTFLFTRRSARARS